MTRAVRHFIFRIALALLLSVTARDAKAQSCPEATTIGTGAVLSGVVAADAQSTEKRVTLLGLIHDYNGNGVKDFLSVEASDLRTVRIRDGRTLDVLWSFQLPAGAVATHLRSIGNVDRVHECPNVPGAVPPSSYNDSTPEFSIGVRYSSGSSQNGVFVFSGTNGQEIARFPNIINGLNPWDHNQETYPAYPNSANINGMTAAFGPTRDGRKLIFGASDAMNGVGVYLACFFDSVNMRYIEEYKMVRGAIPFGSQNRSLMGGLLTLKGPGEFRQLIAVDHKLDYHLNLPGVVDPNLINGGGVLFSSSNSNTLQNLVPPRAGDLNTGFATENVGDMNGDGYEDIAFSSPGDSDDPLAGNFVDVYSGQNLNPIATEVGGISQIGSQIGYAVAGGADLNEDAIADLAISSPTDGGTGRVRIYSGSGFTVKFTLQGTVQGQGFGHSAIIPEAGKIIVVDRSGNLSLFRLGLDASNPQGGSSDGIPDYCQNIPPPFVPLEASLQAVVDGVFKNTQKIRELYVAYSAERGNNTRSKNRQERAIKGIVKAAKAIKKLLKGVQPGILSVNAALTTAQADKLISPANSALSLFKKNKSPRSKLKKANVQNNLITSLVKPWVTPEEESP